MELFSEIYSLYFRAVENVLRLAGERPLSSGEVQKALAEGTFSESAITMISKLQNGDWPLLHKTESGYITSCVTHEKTPLTVLQRSWIKALLSDARIRLFFDEFEFEQMQSALSDVEPLYSQEDFYIFDKAADSDDYSNTDYQRRFRYILLAIRQNAALSILYEGGKGNRVSGVFWPYRLEYSPKDDKFRAHCYRKTGGRKMNYILNLARLTSAEPMSSPEPLPHTLKIAGANDKFREVIIEITKERNALERCMVHFAHFEKRTEYDEATDRYICTIRYNVMDETEVVIRVLSFGPTIKVLGPDEFLSEIRARVHKQSELLSLSGENPVRQ